MCVLSTSHLAHGIRSISAAQQRIDAWLNEQGFHVATVDAPQQPPVAVVAPVTAAAAAPVEVAPVEVAPMATPPAEETPEGAGYKV